MYFLELSKNIEKQSSTKKTPCTGSLSLDGSCVASSATASIVNSESMSRLPRRTGASSPILLKQYKGKFLATLRLYQTMAQSRRENHLCFQLDTGKREAWKARPPESLYAQPSLPFLPNAESKLPGETSKKMPNVGRQPPQRLGVRYILQEIGYSSASLFNYRLIEPTFENMPRR
eukprot:gb/GECG01008805.1/.p1 GENE.gb/GECG01008805.1/~~gb/GECG01008805.1/.p1  ORF type:complete len:175 (+),score=14.62 gb/GECG01008805.1/:1-525(+)